MKKNATDKQLSDLLEYLSKYNLNKIVASPKHKALLKSIIKRYLALVTWQAELKSKKPSGFKSPEDLKQFHLYFEETISDICQSIFLWSQGLYKPASLILRSGIENFLKCIGLYDNQKILNLSSTYDLIAIIKDTQVITSTTHSRREFVKIHQQYKELCSSVHTSNSNHMSLTTAIGKFPQFNESKAKSLAKRYKVILISICTLLCFMFPRGYKKMHHKNLDVISDILSKSVKEKIMQMS
jgi:hypothetical protein